MRLGLRAGLIVVGVMLASLLIPQGAQAQEGPSITVTPNTGLQDGQTVLVDATGFTGVPVAGWAVGQCTPAVLGEPDVTTVNNSCIFTTLVETTGSSFTVEVVVVKQGVSVGGQPITCGQAPADCVIFVGQLLQAGGAHLATQPITFGLPTPASKAACKSGGWRNFANDVGQPFRNQGQCVSYVVSRRR